MGGFSSYKIPNVRIPGIPNLQTDAFLKNQNQTDITKGNIKVPVSVPNTPIAKELSGNALILKNYLEGDPQNGVPIGVKLKPPGKEVKVAGGQQYTIVADEKGNLYALSRRAKLTNSPGSIEKPNPRLDGPRGHYVVADVGFQAIPLTALFHHVTAKSFKSNPAETLKILEAVVSGNVVDKGKVIPHPYFVWKNGKPDLNIHYTRNVSPAEKNTQDYIKDVDNSRTNQNKKIIEAGKEIEENKNLFERGVDILRDIKNRR